MELRYLKYFQKVAEMQHISHAAEVLHIAQPALSRVIRNMEEELGVKLFDRGGKSVVLNENGRIVLKYTQVIFEALSRMNTELACQKDMDSLVVRIAFNSASLLLPVVVSSFCKQYPSIHVEFTNQYGDVKPNTMFRIDSYAQEMDEKDYTPLLREKFFLAYPSSHRFASMEQIQPEEFKKETFLYSKGCHSVYDATKALCRRYNVQPAGIMECVSNETVLSFLDSGIGVALVPNITWNLCHHPQILIREVPGGPMYRTLYLQRLFSLDHFTAANDFQDFCISFFERVQNVAENHDTCKLSIVNLLNENDS